MREEQLKALQGEYQWSRKRKEDILHRLWGDILREYRMDNFRQVFDFVATYKNADEDTWLAANVGRVGTLNNLCRKMTALTTLRNPRMAIDSQHPWNRPLATVLGQWFDQAQEQVEWGRKMRKVNRSSILLGTGVAKIGYSSQYVYGETAWSTAMPPEARAKINRDTLPTWEGHMPYGPSTEYTDFTVREGYPTLIHVPTEDVFFNAGARARNEIRRIYHRSWRPVRDVLHDVRYSREARQEIWDRRAWSGRDDSAFLLSTSVQCDEDFGWVETVEVTDLASRQFAAFEPSCDTALRDWAAIPIPIDNPFLFYTPIEDPYWVWGIPYALLILGQAKAINETRAALIHEIMQNGKQVVAYDLSMDEAVTERMKRSRHMDWVGVHNLQGMEKDPFRIISFGGANAETLRLASVLQQDQSWMSGLTDQTRMAPGSSDETATAANMRMQAENLTTEEFIAMQEEFNEDCAKAFIKVAVATWPAERMIHVVGPSPEFYFWMPMERRRLLTDWTVRVVAGSSQKQDRPTLRKQWMECLSQVNVIYQAMRNDQAMQAQGMPPGPVDWLEVLRITVGLYDPTWPALMLRSQNLPELLMRLMQQHGMQPVEISPQLAQQVQNYLNIQAQQQQALSSGLPLGQSALQGFGVTQDGEGVSGAEMFGTPQPSRIQDGIAPQQLSGNTTGRALSEARG